MKIKMTPVGRIVYFSCGSYSDYTIYGFAKVIVEFNYEDEKEAYQKENPDREEPVPEEWKSMSWWRGKETRIVNPRSISGFISYLVQKGLIEEIETEEFYED